METTKNLKLPQYTGEDIFDLQDINKAYDSIDKAYGDLDDARKEVVNIKNEIPKTNATAEVISARGGKETLGKRLDEFGSQLDTKTSKEETKNIQVKLTDDIKTINSQLDTIDSKMAELKIEDLIKINNKIKSASIYMPVNSVSTEENFTTIIEKCKDSNCNTITICPIFWLESKTSNVFTGYKTGLSKEKILSYCTIVKNNGLKVAIKPHVGGEGISSHGDIQPTNLTTWITNYSTLYKELLTLCKDYVDIVCIANELNGQTNSNLSQWKQLISEVRGIKNSFLIGTACHFGELSTNVFLSELDFLGCNMYVPIEGDMSTNIEKQRKSLFTLTNSINTLLKKGDELNKPIIITEVGILPFEMSLSNPEKWGFTEEPPIVEDVQVRYYNLALKEYLYGNNIIGTFIWNACDGFTFIDRKAQQTVKELYGGGKNV